jgi:hypothetical protein
MITQGNPWFPWETPPSTFFWMSAGAGQAGSS